MAISTSVLSTGLKRMDIGLLEFVQRRMTKMIHVLKSLTYGERLRLNFHTLKRRRVRGDFIEVFKWLKSYNKEDRFSSIYKMAKNTEKLYDLVIYGATGFTGQYVVKEVARVASLEEEKGQMLKWAIAGRNKEKLVSTLKSSGIGAGDIGVIEADNQNIDSLANMANQAKVVINCVGPYHTFGEPVVKACIENGASHVDISGEPQFLESMQLKYDEEAEKAKVHIVGACGYDSIPADIGLCHMIKNFPGELNSVECFLTTQGGRGVTIHTGTMESAALAVANADQVREIRQQLYPQKLPKPKFQKEKRGLLHRNPDVGRWCIPLPTDEPVVYRTQRYLAQSQTVPRPIQFQGFFTCGNMFQACGMIIGSLYFLMLCSFRWTRNLLIKYPEIMTAGVFSQAGPTQEQLETLSFTSTLVGRGWPEKLAEPSDEHAAAPEAKIIVKVSGGDPGYGATSLMLVAAAMTLLRENSKCPRPGGVMTPGMAFLNTSIVDRLVERGMKVSVEKLW